MSIGVVALVVGILIAALLGVVAYALLRRPPQAAHVAGRVAPAEFTPVEMRRATVEAPVNTTDADAALTEVRREAAELRALANADADQIRQRAIEIKEHAQQARADVEIEVRTTRADLTAQRQDLERRESRLLEREERLDSEARTLEERAVELVELEAAIDQKTAALRDVEDERRAILERVAQLTAEQAKAELVASVETHAKRDAALLVREIEREANEQGEARAREIITLAIQRLASEQTAESVVSVLHLPADEMKGRIIGREGRNIRAFEQVTGVNLIIDDTPEAVLLSCFDPVRREVGRLTLEELVLDGRIHPHRIEEQYEQSKAEVEKLCVRAGARRESLEAYVKRLERLEEIAKAHDGVEKVFAMQAGREIRVMVLPDVVDDLAAGVLARDIAKQVEEELTYPGQIRVTVVRESRATEFAR